MKTINKKQICIFIAICAFIVSKILPNEINNLDELWNFNFTRCMANGLIPYKDFNIILGPLLPFICSIFLRFFGQELIVTRILAVVLYATTIFIFYKIMDKLKIKNFIKYIILILSIYITKDFFALDYNWLIALFCGIIIYIELDKTKTWKQNLLIGILIGLTVTVKQTIGLVIAFGTIGYRLLEVRNKQDFKIFLSYVGVRLIGFIFVISAFVLILLVTGALPYYIDYCILGISTFTNKISYMGLIRNSNLIIRFLSAVPIIIVLLLGYIYIRKGKREALLLLVYSLIMMILVYPISDKSHFVLGVQGILISMAYLLNLFINKLPAQKKIEIFTNSFIECAMIATAVIFLIFGINDFKSKNINLELEHFKYLPLSTESINNIKKVDEFIESQEKPVYILDSDAALYMIPVNRYNKNYDMFNQGNLGSKGEDGQIENLKNTENKIILIKNKKYSLNWQTPMKVRDYIIKNMTKTGEIHIFDIYE